MKKTFTPAEELLYLYYIHFSLVVVFGILPWYIPIAFLLPPTASIWILIPTLFTMWFVWYWIPKYYKSMEYIITDKEIIWNRGIWFKNSTHIHFNHITDFRVTQGPIARRLGVYTIAVHTAGKGTALPEMWIYGVKEPEELVKTLEKHVGRPKAVEVFEEDTTSEILKELKRIRKILEKHERVK